MQLDRAQLWNWEHVRLAPEGAGRFAVDYVGRLEQRWEVCRILGLRDEPVPPLPGGAARGDCAALASEAPVPGGLHVPFHIDAVVELGRPLEAIVAGYRGHVSRVVRKHAQRARSRRVVESEEIERLQRDMLESFGIAHHGPHAVNLSLEAVRRIATETGRLDLAYLDNDEIGCHLGYTVVHKGRRYWEGVRVGYPEAIYTDSHRLALANTVNVHLALGWALDSGFDFYNMGMTQAQPDGGLLKFKHRRGGKLTSDFTDAFFWVRLPARGRAHFLWEAPLFSVEHGRLLLHLGLPGERDDAEVIARYREMGFDGLSRVQLYCARPPSGSLLDKFSALYARYDEPPELVEVPG